MNNPVANTNHIVNNIKTTKDITQQNNEMSVMMTNCKQVKNIHELNEIYFPYMCRRITEGQHINAALNASVKHHIYYTVTVVPHSHINDTMSQQHSVIFTIQCHIITYTIQYHSTTNTIQLHSTTSSNTAYNVTAPQCHIHHTISQHHIHHTMSQSHKITYSYNVTIAVSHTLYNVKEPQSHSTSVTYIIQCHRAVKPHTHTMSQ